jgi:hypothetical protein
MKKIYAAALAIFFTGASFAQICNPTGNLILFTNYDGGTLNINLDAPMSNIMIGVCSYEGVNINISGIGASSVTAVAYAGYNGTGTSCTGSVVNTNITGTPGTSTNTITMYPPSPISNPYGYGSIICGYSCSTTTYQGGCNTIDQIEAYFLNLFPGSTIFSHKVQYGCWTGTQNVTAGGTCCSVTTGFAPTVEASFSVFPNPAASELHVSSATGFNNAYFRIFSLDGKLVSDKAALSEAVDIAALDAGIYFIEISDGTLVSRKRFVKE